MTGLTRAFSAARGEGRSLLLPYLMAGVPDADTSVALFEAMAQRGADGFEVGIPYSDPLMDGPIIQEAGRRALASGMTLGKGIEVAGRVVESTGLPCMVMTYVNPILRCGVERFMSDVAAAGIDAVIIADLPVDEAAVFADAGRDHGVALALFAAPTTTDERLDAVIAGRPPFVYAVGEIGVTGERLEASSHAEHLVSRIRERSEVPVALGVGISGPVAARRAAMVADGVIVGTALVRRVLEATSAGEARASLEEAVGELARAVRRIPDD
jgi:tryptophan synthase alpha chain